MDARSTGGDSSLARRPRFASAIGSRRWIATLAALTGTTALSIDMSLPAQPTLARVFGVSAETAQLTLSLFLVGFAIAQLLAGYLSDAFGRRPLLLWGLGLFTIAGVASAFSPAIHVLLVCRFLQGFGAASAPVIARAMVRDTQPASSAARLLSTMLAVIAIAPMVAPIFGAGLLAVLGWRAIFGALAVIGVVFATLAALTLEETRPRSLRARPSVAGLFRDFGRFFRAPGTRIPMLIGCASFAGQFAYISDSPFVLIEGYGVPASHYSLYFGITALALMGGSTLGGRLLGRGRVPRAMLRIGTLTLAVGGLLVAAGAHAPGFGVAGFIAPMLVYFVGLGLTSPSATAIAMEPLPEIAGTASAAIGFLMMLAGAASGYLTTRVGGSDPKVLGAIIAAMGVLAAILARAPSVGRRRG
jgi:DHA1 family bicyclomycin/chloramphenicol resistance-like MFS transporter